MDADRTRPDQTTRLAEEEEASAAHEPDRAPTPDEEDAATRARDDAALSGDQQEVGEHHRDMTERGVRQKGEGRIP